MAPCPGGRYRSTKFRIYFMASLSYLVIRLKNATVEYHSLNYINIFEDEKYIQAETTTFYDCLYSRGVRKECGGYYSGITICQTLRSVHYALLGISIHVSNSVAMRRFPSLTDRSDHMQQSFTCSSLLHHPSSQTLPCLARDR